MSIQIGKLLPDGRVRHIKALHETLSKDLVRKLRVKTFRESSVYSNTSPAWRYIREIYEKMLAEGKLVEGYKHIGSGKLMLCRTATDREILPDKAKK